MRVSAIAMVHRPVMGESKMTATTFALSLLLFALVSCLPEIVEARAAARRR